MKALALSFLLILSAAACRPAEPLTTVPAPEGVLPAAPVTADPSASDLVPSEPNPAASSPTEPSANPDALRVRLELDGEPRLGAVPVVVYLLAAGEGVAGASVEVAGDMTHAGMSPVIVPATETEPGLYRAEDFAFTMAGDWLLSAEVTLPDGSRAQAETAVSVPAD